MQSSDDLNEITAAIIGAPITVHRALGPGLLEAVYRVCVAHELTKLGHTVLQEEPIPVIYDGVRLDLGFKLDLLVDGVVIVECKAKDRLHPVDKAQMISHLRLLKLRVGLLINFHELVLKDGIRRVVNDFEDPE
jgi:GxxExxY protein